MRFVAQWGCSDRARRTDEMMARDSEQTETASWTGPGMREFVVLMAALMASNALAIDAMLPALPAIGTA